MRSFVPVSKTGGLAGAVANALVAVAMQALAIYDMDETITRKPTLLPFLLSASFRLAPWRVALLPAVAATLAGYMVGAVDRARLKELNQRWLLGATVDPAKLDRHARRFARRTIERGLKAGAVRQIAADRAAGRKLILATASSRFYVDAIAELLRFDAVIATEVTVLDNGHFSPRIHGGNCYGPGKAAKIVDWMASNGVARSDIHLTMYSDHISDVPSFELADEAVVVDPAPALKAEALRRGWSVAEWG